MVEAVRRGRSQRSVAEDFGVRPFTVQYWVDRAKGKRLSRVDWTDRKPGPRRAHNRVDSQMEDLLVETRTELREQSDLGEYGAEAVSRTLIERGYTNVPSVRTINRVFERRGLFDARKRARRKAPPKGWYLPEVAEQRCELDQVDLIEGLKIKDGPLVEVLNIVSLHGGLVGSVPHEASVTAKAAVGSLVGHWRTWGLPQYVQFDNANIFQGPHHHRDTVGRVSRLCLSLGVVPVFVPPMERGFQASIEGYNGKWQAKVWTRFQHKSLKQLRAQSDRYVAAHRQRTRQRRDNGPERDVIPEKWKVNLQRHPGDHPVARLIFIRRTTQSGAVFILGRNFAVDEKWAGRLVRCEVVLDEKVIRFHRLRRRAPTEQPLLRQTPYELPRRRFRE